MALSSHLQELRKKHQFLSDQVEEAQRSPSTDDLTITDLKTQKLRLKDEIQRLSATACRLGRWPARPAPPRPR